MARNYLSAAKIYAKTEKDSLNESTKYIKDSLDAAKIRSQENVKKDKDNALKRIDDIVKTTRDAYEASGAMVSTITEQGKQQAATDISKMGLTQEGFGGAVNLKYDNAKLGQMGKYEFAKKRELSRLATEKTVTDLKYNEMSAQSDAKYSELNLEAEKFTNELAIRREDFMFNAYMDNVRFVNRPRGGSSPATKKPEIIDGKAYWYAGVESEGTLKDYAVFVTQDGTKYVKYMGEITPYEEASAFVQGAVETGDEEALALAEEDKPSYAKDLIDWFGDNWSLGWKQNTQSTWEGKAAEAVRAGDWTKYAEYMQKAGETELDIERFVKENEGILQDKNIISQAFQQMPNMLYKFKKWENWAGYGAAALAGFGIASQGGAAVGAILGLPGAAAAGTVTGLLGAYKAWQAYDVYASAEATYYQEGGSAFGEMLQIGVPPEIAAELSQEVGKLNAFIEAGEESLDLIPGSIFVKNAATGVGVAELAKASGAKLIGKTAIVKWLAENAAKLPLSDAAKGYATHMLRNALSEGIQEALQESVTIDKTKIAAEKSGITRDASGDADRVKQAAIMGAFTSIAFSGMGIAYDGAVRGLASVSTAFKNSNKDTPSKDLTRMYENPEDAPYSSWESPVDMTTKIGETIQVQDKSGQKVDILVTQEMATALTEYRKLDQEEAQRRASSLTNKNNSKKAKSDNDRITKIAEEKAKIAPQIEQFLDVKPVTGKQIALDNFYEHNERAKEWVAKNNADSPQENVRLVVPSQPIHNAAIELAAAFGVSVGFFEGNSSINGLSVGGTGILLNTNPTPNESATGKAAGVQQTFLFTMGHEIAHIIRAKYPEVYSKLIADLKLTLTEEQKTNYRNRYANDKEWYATLENEDILVEEMFADEFGNMVLDKAYMKKLKSTRPSVFRKLVNIVRGLFDQLSGTKFKSELTTEQVKKIRDAFEAIVLNAESEQVSMEASQSTSGVDIAAIVEQLAPNANPDMKAAIISTTESVMAIYDLSPEDAVEVAASAEGTAKVAKKRAEKQAKEKYKAKEKKRLTLASIKSTLEKKLPGMTPENIDAVAKGMNDINDANYDFDSLYAIYGETFVVESMMYEKVLDAAATEKINDNKIAEQQPTDVFEQAARMHEKDAPRIAEMKELQDINKKGGLSKEQYERLFELWAANPNMKEGSGTREGFESKGGYVDYYKIKLASKDESVKESSLEAKVSVKTEQKTLPKKEDARTINLVKERSKLQASKYTEDLLKIDQSLSVDQAIEILDNMFNDDKAPNLDSEKSIQDYIKTKGNRFINAYMNESEDVADVVYEDESTDVQPKTLPKKEKPVIVATKEEIDADNKERLDMVAELVALAEGKVKKEPVAEKKPNENMRSEIEALRGLASEDRTKYRVEVNKILQKYHDKLTDKEKISEYRNMKDFEKAQYYVNDSPIVRKAALLSNDMSDIRISEPVGAEYRTSSEGNTYPMLRLSDDFMLIAYITGKIGENSPILFSDDVKLLMNDSDLQHMIANEEDEFTKKALISKRNKTKSKVEVIRKKADKLKSQWQAEVDAFMSGKEDNAPTSPKPQYVPVKERPVVEKPTLPAKKSEPKVAVNQDMQKIVAYNNVSVPGVYSESDSLIVRTKAVMSAQIGERLKAVGRPVRMEPDLQMIAVMHDSSAAKYIANLTDEAALLAKRNSKDADIERVNFLRDKSELIRNEYQAKLDEFTQQQHAENKAVEEKIMNEPSYTDVIADRKLIQNKLTKKHLLYDKVIDRVSVDERKALADYYDLYENGYEVNAIANVAGKRYVAQIKDLKETGIYTDTDMKSLVPLMAINAKETLDGAEAMVMKDLDKAKIEYVGKGNMIVYSKRPSYYGNKLRTDNARIDSVIAESVKQLRLPENTVAIEPRNKFEKDLFRFANALGYGMVILDTDEVNGMNIGRNVVITTGALNPNIKVKYGNVELAGGKATAIFLLNHEIGHAIVNEFPDLFHRVRNNLSRTITDEELEAHKRHIAFGRETYVNEIITDEISNALGNKDFLSEMKSLMQDLPKNKMFILINHMLKLTDKYKEVAYTFDTGMMQNHIDNVRVMLKSALKNINSYETLKEPSEMTWARERQILTDSNRVFDYVKPSQDAIELVKEIDPDVGRTFDRYSKSVNKLNQDTYKKALTAFDGAYDVVGGAEVAAYTLTRILDDKKSTTMTQKDFDTAHKAAQSQVNMMHKFIDGLVADAKLNTEAEKKAYRKKLEDTMELGIPRTDNDELVMEIADTLNTKTMFVRNSPVAGLTSPGILIFNQTMSDENYKQTIGHEVGHMLENVEEFEMQKLVRDIAQILTDSGVNLYEYLNTYHYVAQETATPYSAIKEIIYDELSNLLNNGAYWDKAVKVNPGKSGLLKIVSALDWMTGKAEKRRTPLDDKSKTLIKSTATRIIETQNMYKYSKQKTSAFAENTIPKTQWLKDALAQIPEIRNYMEITNKETLEKAKLIVEKAGQNGVHMWLSSEQEANEVNLVVGMIYAAMEKDDVMQASILTKVVDMGRTGGRTVQAISMFQRLSPTGMLLYATNQMQRVKVKLEEAAKSDPFLDAQIKDNPDVFVFTQAEKDWITSMMKMMREGGVIGDEGAMQEILGAIEMYIKWKIPKTTENKMNSIMRTFMLSGLKTPIRNFLSNVSMKQMNRVRMMIADAIDRQYAAQTGVRSVTALDNATFRENWYKGIKDVMDRAMRGEFVGDPKFQFMNVDLFNDKTLPGKAMNEFTRWVNFTLAMGDEPYRFAYKAALMKSLLEANGMTKPTIEMQRMVDEEVHKILFTNESMPVKLLQKTRTILNKVRIPALGIGLGDITLPFITVGGNIAATMYHYSPVAAFSVAQEMKKFNAAKASGNMTMSVQNSLVNTMAKALTGTMMYIMAGAISQLIEATGREEDDPTKKALNKLNGVQPYSVKIGDYWVSYDWMLPAMTPLVFASNASKIVEEGGDTMAMVSGAIKEASGVIFEQSLFMGLQTLFSDENLGKGFLEVAADVPGRFVPTIIKDINSAFDRNVRYSYDGTNILNTAANKVIAKTPFASAYLPKKYDTLGKEQMKSQGLTWQYALANFLSPAWVSKPKIDKVTKEIETLYKRTKDSSIIPGTVDSTMTINDKPKVLTNEQKSKFQREMGVTVANMYEKLFDSVQYKSLDDRDRIQVMKAIKEYASQRATKLLFPEYKPGDSAEYAIITKRNYKTPDQILNYFISRSADLDPDR